MNRYRVLPGAIEHIAASLKTLKLTPADPAYTPAVAIRHRARYYMTPMRTSRGGLVWFKASLQNEPHLRRALREEIRVQKLFADYEETSRPHFDSPAYIAHHDDRRGHLWLVRRYWDGLFAGDMTEWFGFSPAFFRAVTPQQMARIVADVRQMTRFIGRRSRLEPHALGWYMLDFHYYEREFFRPMIKAHPAPNWTTETVESISELFLGQRRFFQTQATAFTHGDLYPTNIMIRATARRPVVLFDWELSHLNLPTFDAAMIYLHAWRQPRWQAAFRHHIMVALGDTPRARLAWRLAVVSLATRLAGFDYIRLHNLQPDRYPRLPAKQRPTLERQYRLFMRELWDALHPTRP